MTYHTLSTPVQAVYDIKKSTFLGFGYPIDSRDELMFYVEQLRQQYPDARHVCYGYIIGDPNNTTSAGFDDDGEPNGTAGRPILNVLQHKAIGNACILVVRYFGGIKLGAGGLTRAYSTACQLVVDNMILSPFVAKSMITIDTAFAHEAYVRHLLANINGELLDVCYTKTVKITAQIANQDHAKLVADLGIYGQITEVAIT